MDDRETIVDREAEIKGLERELHTVRMELETVRMELEMAKDYAEEERTRRLEAETGMERVLQMFDLLKKEN